MWAFPDKPWDISLNRDSRYNEQRLLRPFGARRSCGQVGWVCLCQRGVSWDLYTAGAHWLGFQKVHLNAFILEWSKSKSLRLKAFHLRLVEVIVTLRVNTESMLLLPWPSFFTKSFKANILIQLIFQAVSRSDSVGRQEISVTKANHD